MQKKDNLYIGGSNYECPTLTITAVTVEKGFQATGGATNEQLEDETYE